MMAQDPEFSTEVSNVLENSTSLLNGSSNIISNHEDNNDETTSNTNNKRESLIVSGNSRTGLNLTISPPPSEDLESAANNPIVEKEHRSNSNNGSICSDQV